MIWLITIGINENIHLVNHDNGNHLTTGTEIVAIWAKEAENFDFANPRWNLSKNCPFKLTLS